MAEEIRLLRNDTYELIVSVIDSETELPVPIISNNWNVALESETINKNSVDSPIDFLIEVSPLTTGQIDIHISQSETNQTVCKSHYKIRLFKNTVTKTVSSGDFIFIDEL